MSNNRRDNKRPGETNGSWQAHSMNEHAPDGRRRILRPTRLDALLAAFDAIQNARAASGNPWRPLDSNSPEARHFEQSYHALVGSPEPDPVPLNDSFAPSAHDPLMGPAPFFTQPSNGAQQYTDLYDNGLMQNGHLRGMTVNNNVNGAQQGFRIPLQQLSLLPIHFGATANNSPRLTGVPNLGNHQRHGPGDMNQPNYPSTSYPAPNHNNQMYNGGMAGYNSLMNGYGPATGRTYQSLLNPFAHSILTPTYGTGQGQGARRSRSPLPAPPVYRDRSTVLRRPDTGSRLLPGSSDDVGNDPPAESSSEGDHQNVIRATKGKLRIGCDRCRLMHIKCDILDLPVGTKSCGPCNGSADRTAKDRCVLTQADGTTDLGPARAYKRKQERRSAARKAAKRAREAEDIEDEGDNEEEGGIEDDE